MKNKDIIILMLIAIIVVLVSQNILSTNDITKTQTKVQSTTKIKEETTNGKDIEIKVNELESNSSVTEELPFGNFSTDANVELEKVVNIYKQKTTKFTKDIKSTIVSIYDIDDNMAGTGFIVDEYNGKTIIMTCKHVVDPNHKNPTTTNTRITFNDGSQIDTSPIIFYTKHDMVVLAVDFDISQNPNINVVDLRYESYDLSSKNLIFFNKADYTKDMLEYHATNISSLQNYAYSINDIGISITSGDDSLTNGSSGSGVFLENGNLIGMIYGKSMYMEIYTIRPIMETLYRFQAQ